MSEVEHERHDPTAILTVNRPEHRNRENTPMPESPTSAAARPPS